MARYTPEDDEIIWESEPIQHKAKATMRVVIKRYKGGPPKLQVIEDGEGYQQRRYQGILVKRVDVENLEFLKKLLILGGEQLRVFAKKYEEQQANAKSTDSASETGSPDTDGS
jgi:hypothetical protein